MKNKGFSGSKMAELQEQISLLKELLQSEKEKNRDLERFYQNELEKSESRYLQIKEECGILRNDSKFMMQEVIESEKNAILGKFASILAHDLRTPLTTIQGAMDLMNLKPVINTKEKNKYFPQVKKSIKRINELLEDVLGYVRNSPLHIELHSIKKICNDVLEIIDIPKEIKINISETDQIIECDAQRLKSVFSNILVNSIQSLGKKGEIKINIKKLKNKVIILFQDSGPGIPTDKLHSVFEPLFTTKEHGTGLGLPICKKIIDMHKGTISVTNNPTTFTIRLPISQS